MIYLNKYLYNALMAERIWMKLIRQTVYMFWIKTKARFYPKKGNLKKFWYLEYNKAHTEHIL